MAGMTSHAKGSPQIAIIGAGSAQFTLDLIRDISLTEGLAGSTVWLVGHVNRQKVEQVTSVGSRYSEEMGAGIRFHVTYDRREALKGSDFVINAAAVSPHHNIRQMMLFMDVVQDMEELCPEAWLIMAANPVFQGCTLMTRQSPVKVIGLCHGFREGVRNIAEVLGLDLEDVHAQVAGLNHNVWLTDLVYRGEDAYPLIDHWIENQAEDYWKGPAFNGGKLEWGNLSPKAVHMYRFFGLLPIGDTAGHSSPWWYLEGEEIQRRMGYVFEDWREVYEGHINAKMEAIRQADAHPEVAVSTFIPPQKSTGHDHIHIIDAIANDRPGQYVVNIPNRGAIDGIADDVVVEIPALVSGLGVQGLRMGPLPPLILLNIQAAIVRMEAELQAYLSGDRNALVASFLDEPWNVRSLDEAEERADRLLSSDARLAKHFSSAA
jgi:alpha-galactosidase